MDLISRQAAINALGKDPMGGLNYERILGSLPSIQTEIVAGRDCISRQAAFDEIKKCRFVVDAIEKIRKLPSIQSKRIRGKWIGEGYYADGHGACVFRCSECGGHIIEYDVDPFCRWCGADMRGEQDG